MFGCGDAGESLGEGGNGESLRSGKGSRRKGYLVVVGNLIVVVVVVVVG